MTDILIRGVTREVLDHIDEQAASRGMSRNEFLVATLTTRFSSDRAVVTGDDLLRSSLATTDLANKELMAEAWQ